MNERDSRTMIDIALIATVILIALAIFGKVAWWAFLLPLPFALFISVIISLLVGIYARYRNR